jgi:hypothetical protein
MGWTGSASRPSPRLRTPVEPSRFPCAATLREVGPYVSVENDDRSEHADKKSDEYGRNPDLELLTAGALIVGTIFGAQH